MRHSLALLAFALLLAPSAEAQIRQHTLTAVVDTGSGLSGGAFGIVSPGDTISVVLDVDPTSNGVNLPGGLDVTTYWRAVVGASVTIGGEVESTPLVRSWVGIDNDIDQIQTCSDSLEVRVFAADGYLQLGFDTTVIAAGCPTVNEWLEFPTKIFVAPAPLNTLTSNTLFLQVETEGRLETLTAVVTSETIGNTLHGIEHCTGDGGDQLGCTNCPCTANALPGTLGGCPSSAGTSARLRGSGSASTSLTPGASNDLRFAIQGAPLSTLCVLTSGDALAPLGMANPCFGQGTYRDLCSAGCGRGLNTSQAVEITFEP